MKAFAKINLTLRVLGVRPDGYHELETTFQSILLHDTLTIASGATRPGGSREVEDIRIDCDDPACPRDRRNLAWQAAQLTWRAAGRTGAPRGLRIKIAKRIPVQAGLGGGSADAAAVVRACARLWRIKAGRLPAIAAELGADVPFFLHGGTAIGRDRGDRLDSLRDWPSSWIVLVQPAFGVSTVEAYRWWDEQGESARRQDVASRGHAVTGDPGRVNDLEAPVAARHPEITRIVTALCGKGASRAAMSGSGSSVFGMFETRAAAASAAASQAAPGRRVVVTRTLGRAEYKVLSRVTA